MGIPSSGTHFEDSVLDGEQRHIERAPSEIENEHVPLGLALVILPVQTVSNGSRGGLIDNSHHVHSGDGSGVLCGKSLRIVEVGGNSYNSVLYVLAQVALSNLLHLDQNHGRDLLRCEALLLPLVLHSNNWFVSILGLDLEREMLHVRLNRRIRKTTSN
mmetsp:Transcript_11235/g.16242  ORF Transcript_11235/g.16242 Transcript_11235/m.16242 type:complete len:159 (+) Transcript_11235:1453-1929(+)